jgi:Fungal specific transcription factor domain
MDLSRRHRTKSTIQNLNQTSQEQSLKQLQTPVVTAELANTINVLAVQFALPLSLSQSVVDIAFQHFLRSYIPSSQFNYLLSMLDEFSASRCFTSATKAVALANLARERRDNELMRQSCSLHAKAVRDVNTALKSPEVNENSTLFATLILGLFEAIVLSYENQSGPISNFLDNWVTHTNGTFSLIKYRGMDFLQTEFGKKIYYHVANRIRGNCAQRGIRLPAEFIKLDKQLAHSMQDMGPVARFWIIPDMVSELRARIRG